MRAWTLYRSGDIRLEDVELPALKDNEVRIRMEAAGICASDIPRIYDTGAHRMPLIPGHEFAGMVEGIGQGVDAYWMTKRVAVFPKIPCGHCRQCRSGFYEMCTDYDYIGSRRDGAFAEYVNVPAENLLELPEQVTFEQGAMLEPLAVAANAMRTGCQRGRSVLPLDRPVAVCGLGTIGLAVAMLLADAGYQKIYLIGNKDTQGRFAEKELGLPAENVCNSRTTDAVEWLKDISDGGVYAYFECTGSNEAIRYGIEAAAPGGWMVMVGNPKTDMHFAKDVYWEILRKQMIICGIWNSTFRLSGSLDRGDDPDDWNYILQRLQEKRIAPEKLISHRFSIGELDQGWILMHEKSGHHCKVMMVRDDAEDLRM